MGLLPILRRVWSEKGQPLLAPTHRRYDWLYLYGFVHPQSGRTEWLILSTVNTEAFERSLQEFAKAVRAGPQKLILLVVDQAGWHRSKTLRVPEGIELVPLPPYSPELQPAERLWPLVREVVANQAIATLDDLDQLLGTRCCFLADHPDLVQGYTAYHWWPNDVTPLPGSIN